MTNERDGLKPGPLTADLVPLLTAGRSVLTFQDDRLVTFEGADDRGDISFTRPDGYRRNGRHHGFFSYIGERGDDGWISWAGGENPVPGREVETRHRGGGEAEWPSDRWEAGSRSFWDHTGSNTDIIAFRLVEAPADQGSSLRDTQPVAGTPVVAVPRDQLETLRRSLQLGNLLPGEGENLISLWILASDAEARS